VLAVLAVVSGAYLFAHFVLDWLQQRFLFISGFEYVALGVVLGPVAFPELAPFADLNGMAPVFAFAAGWVGLLFGLELRLGGGGLTGRPMRIAAVDGAVTGTTILLFGQWFFQSGLALPPVPPSQAWMAAGALGCAAAAGSSSAVDLLSARYRDGLQTSLLPMLRRASRLGDVLAISVFGVLFCLFHEGTTQRGDPGFSDWFLLTAGIGLVLGVLFFVYIGNARDENHVFLTMVGILLFASGAAFFLHLSALLVNLILGAVLAQTRQGAKLSGQLERTERPVSLVLLLFAGALWEPVPLLPGVIVVLGFLGLRLVGKVVASSLATVGTPLRTDLFRGMMSQGNAAVAMALSLRLVYHGPAIDLAYTAILCGVVLHELISPRMLRGLLVDAGELDQDIPAARVA